MPKLAWDQFVGLPGAATDNWERLCRAVVVRSFGHLGSVRAVAQQPGVEFHLKLEQSSGVLGGPQRWWGWQCRWYGLPSGRRIGAKRRARVEESIRKTEEHVPGLTDWVLWTRRPLTHADQEWFYGIDSSMQLHLWTEADLDTHLVGDAEILRRTYFGDLIFTPDRLREVRERSLAPAREHWNPALHVEVDAESEVLKILGEPDCWPELSEQANALVASAEELTEAVREMESGLREAVSPLVADLSDLRLAFGTIAAALAGDKVTRATELVAVDWTPRLTRANGRQLARALTRNRHPSSIVVQAGLARHHEATSLFAEFRRYLSIRALAVIAPAGRGKTHLAAELTAERGARPSGVFLEAWPLRRTGTVDDLLPRLRGVSAGSFGEVLEAMEAAGARAGTRLPIVIDGLNESEDPANWKAELETLSVMLERFHHVVVVVTLRPSVATFALPESLPRCELPDFGPLTVEAIRKYFEHYKIDAGNLHLPLERFSDPLFLRTFCEATNPDRDVQVTPEEVPASLVAALARFRDTKVKRIAHQPGGISRHEQDILRALEDIALSFWESGRRAMPFREIRELINDEGADWTQSLARALRDEGILSSDPDDAGDVRTVILFDRFAGFLIADTLTRRKGKDDFAAWIAEDHTLELLGIDPTQAHPLASDIREAFVGLVPRRFRVQLWQLVDGDLRAEALMGAAELEGKWLDADTVDEIARLAVLPRNAGDPHPSGRRRDLFERFREVRDVTGHPLNADFLDRLLNGLSVTDRDLRWSEWVRHWEDESLSDVRAFIKDWQARTDRTPDDRLRALWLKWLLTSTLRDVRDSATHALYWYGRGKPEALFRLTVSGLMTNDPYVPERLLAAAFGVMMAAPGEQREFDDELRAFLDAIWTALAAKEPTSPTDHWLMREYVGGIVAVVRRYYGNRLGEWSDGISFVPRRRPDPIHRGDPRIAGRDLVYGMDFKNYTVGRLVPGRLPYDYHHPGYEEVLSWIRARVWELGWRPEHFRSIERVMAELQWRRDRRLGRLESYLKKYGWIGFYEAAGRLADEGRSPLKPDEAHLPDVDIDPSFPAKPPASDLTIPGWLPREPRDLEAWVTRGEVDIPDRLLRPESLRDFDGPWVGLSGFLEQRDRESRRATFGFLQAVLVRNSDQEHLRALLLESARPVSGHSVSPTEAYGAFAGEIPWSASARLGATPDELTELYTRTIAGSDGREIDVEVPAHRYGWESNWSVTKGAGGQSVPAITLAAAFDLRALPSSLDWCDPQGHRASMTLAPPLGFEEGGYLLYVREDLIRQYCNQHDYELFWIVWGERVPWFTAPLAERPAWLDEVYTSESNVWCRIATLGELAL